MQDGLSVPQMALRSALHQLTFLLFLAVLLLISFGIISPYGTGVASVGFIGKEKTAAVCTMQSRVFYCNASCTLV